MKKTAILVAIGILIMGTFCFAKDKNSIDTDSDSTITGMILLEQPNSMQIKEVLTELREDWELKVEEKQSNDSASLFTIDGYDVAIINIAEPIAGDEIKNFNIYNYFWKNGAAEASKHKGYIILSILNAGKDPTKENILFNKMAAAILKNSKSIGIYIRERTLLLKKEIYLNNTDMMTDKNLPLYNWIYFGLRKSNGKLSIYTFGLSAFNKKEMEIVESSKTLKELTETMYDLVHYIILNNLTLKDGDTVPLSENQNFKVKESPGIYLESITFKVDY